MTQDLAINLLLSRLQQVSAEQHCTWFADENSLAILPLLAQTSAKLALCTNRYDIHTQALALGINSAFNDAQLAEQITPQTQHVFIRISKEKPLAHHTINQAAQTLKNDATLHLAGLKGEGIKTYLKKTQTLFLKSSATKKNKDAHYGAFASANSDAAPLDTQNYDQLREIGSFNNQTMLSKPGVFGFEKIDEGSELLLDVTQKYLQNHNIQPHNQLDLGCGYGLLTFGSRHWGSKNFTATDNNAAALLAITASAKANNLELEIVAADAGAEIKGAFDCILCNPPFHQGFSISGDLTDKFLNHASQKLSPKGHAFFVVNSFIGIEKKASRYFKQQETLTNTKRFKVLALSNH